MDSFNVNFPYPIGTYLSKEEDGQIHIDQLEEYTIDKNGLHAYLILDVFTNPRLSMKIDIDNLINKWSISENYNHYSNKR